MTSRAVAQQIIEACAKAAEAVDREGREWVRESLWANILRRAGANVRAVDPNQFADGSAPDMEAKVTTISHMLAAQRGCFWIQLTGPAKAQMRRDADEIIAEVLKADGP